MTDTNGYFDKVGDRYDSYSFLSNDFQLQHILSKLPKIDESCYVLDVGTGTGNFGGLFVDSVSLVIGLDINAKLLKLARAKRVRSVIGTANHIPFRTESFDLVLCRQLFQYLSDNEIHEALTEMFKVLKPGATLILHNTTAPNEALEKYFRKFMEIIGQNIRYPCLEQLDILFKQAGFKIKHRKLQSFTITENSDDFIKNRNIGVESMKERIDIISDIYDFNLKYIEGGISYNRYYSLLVAEK